MSETTDITSKQLDEMNKWCSDTRDAMKLYKFSFEIHQLAMAYNVTAVVLDITYDLRATLYMYNPHHKDTIELLESQKQILIEKINKLYNEIKELK